MNTPNKLTTLRMLLVPVFVIAFYYEVKMGQSVLLISTIIFAVASTTDFLDGYLARKYNLVTDFGKFMDPLADKVLVTASLVCLVEIARIPAWMVIIIITREYAISILRAIAASSGKVLAASKGGKAKTATQMVALIMIMLQIPYGDIIFIISLILTVYSGVEYIYVNRHLIETY